MCLCWFSLSSSDSCYKSDGKVSSYDCGVLFLLLILSMLKTTTIVVFNSIIESICFIFTVLREFLFFSTEIFDSLKMFHLFAGTVASLESVSVPFSASYQSQTKLFFFSSWNPVSFSWFVIYLVILSCILNILNIEM